MMMCIYLVKNFTRCELYFGMTEKSAREAVLAHRHNPLSPLSHWHWDREEIKWGEVQGGLPVETAAAFLQALRRQPPDDGWVVVMSPETE